MNAVPFEIRQRMVRFRNSYIKAGMGSRRVTTLSPSFIYSKGVALIQSRTLCCMDAAAKPPWMALRRVLLSYKVLFYV